MIKAVLFDYGGVVKIAHPLYIDTPKILNITQEEFDAIKPKRSEFILLAEKGLISDKEVWTSLSKIIGKQVPENAVELAAKFYRENFVFTGREFLFLNLCKSVFVHARLDSSLEFNILSGLEIVQNYYVEQGDGSLRTLSDLINRTHLLVILCTTNIANKVLAKVIQQVVEGRNRIGRGTWIYAPENFSSKTEYSPDLINTTLKWKTINL